MEKFNLQTQSLTEGQNMGGEVTNMVVPYLKGLKITLIVLCTLGLTVVSFVLGFFIVAAIMNTLDTDMKSLVPVIIPLLIIAIIYYVITLMGIIKENIKIIMVILILSVIAMLLDLIAMNFKGLVGSLIMNLLYYWYYTLLIKKKKLIAVLGHNQQMNNI